MVSHGSLESCAPSLMRRPSASSFGQKRAAMPRLIIATRAPPALSASENARPPTEEIFNVPKKSGLAICRSAEGASLALSAGRPSMEKRSRTAKDLLIEISDLHVVRVDFLRQGNLSTQNTGRFESLIGTRETHKSLNGLARAHQLDQRNHDLRDHQCAAHSPLRGSYGAGSGFFESLVRLHTAGVENGHQAQKNSHTERSQYRKGQNVAVDANPIPAGHPLGPAYGDAGAQRANIGERSGDRNNTRSSRIH